jgi:hypothetical protein
MHDAHADTASLYLCSVHLSATARETLMSAIINPHSVTRFDYPSAVTGWVKLPPPEDNVHIFGALD